MDDRFYILVNGKCLVERHGKTLGLPSTAATASARPVTCAARAAPRRSRRRPRCRVLRVSSTLLEQVSAACQLRFNRVFLRALIGRLQGNDRAARVSLDVRS